MTPLSEDAPAKINLALHVTGKRADGYHLLESLVVFTRFGDNLTVTPADRDLVNIDGPYSRGLPVDDSNLIVRARDALTSYLGELFDPPPTAIHLEKFLPVASGIGGGSSDAAAALRALNRLWHAGLGEAQLAEIGLSLGADVPMCVAARPAVARGIGEVLEPISALPRLPIVLVNPGVAVATPAVFKALGSPDNPPLPTVPAGADFTQLIEWLRSTRNDLQPPAISVAPVISSALAALEHEQAAFARMSGSGATCFGLFATSAQAMRAAMAIRAAQPGWFVVATETTG